VTLSLRARLFIGSLLAVWAALALLTLLAMREERGWVEHEARARLERDARAAVGALATSSADPSGLRLQARRFATDRAHRYTLIASDGRVLADSDVPDEQLARLENHGARPEVRAALGGATGVQRRHSATLDRDLLYVAVPVPGARPVAVVRVAEPLADLSQSSGALARRLLLAALLAFAIMVLLVYAASGRHAARIVELEQVARRLGAGDAAVRARELPPDEVGRLGGALNRMAGELRDRIVTLERERDQQRVILSRMSDGVALVDGDDRVVRANASLAELLDLMLPPEPGTPLRAVARSPELADALATARREERTIESEIHLWAPRERLLRATVTPLAGPPPGGAVLVLRDLTELERAQRIRQEFVANVSHELKTPLTSLRGYAETLLEGGLDDPEHRVGFVRVIHDQAGRLQALVEDLLTLADLERPDAHLHRETFDLRELVAGLLPAFEERAQRAGLSLTLAPGPVAPVDADRRRIEQVVANLLDNALKYTERGGITISLGGDTAHAWGEFRDTGPGIPARDQARVFERFYRVDKARSRGQGGTGLGLSIVKHILALHDGSITVASAPGGGSIFRFEIPRTHR
jgi:two-component system phosphate regulon sensor histidine kinase PhoR